MNKNKEKNRLLINTLLIAFGNLGAKLIGFLLLPLYTSLLSTSEYGTYDFILTIASFLVPIVSINIYESLFRFLIEANQKNDNNLFKKTISSSVIIAIITMIIYVAISSIVYGITKIDYIPILTLYVISTYIYTYLISLLRGIGKIKTYALYSGIKNLVQVVFCYLAIAVFGFGIYGLLYASIIPSLFVSLVIFIQFKVYKYISISKENFTMVKKLTKYSLPLVPDSISSSILTMSDRIVVKNYLGTSENGIYSIAHKFPSVIEVLYHFFITSWNESASRVYEQDEEQAKEYYQNLYEFTIKVLISGVLLIMASMPILFRILIKGDYVTAFNYTPFLLLAQLFNSIANFYSGILIAHKNTKAIAKTTIISAVINIILNIILVILIGIYGVLISTLVSNIILLILRRRQSNKYVKLKENKLYIFICCIILAITIALYNYTNLVLCFISVLITGLFFIYSNKNIIVNMIKKIFKLEKE